jgi:arylsulfatase
VLGAAGYQTMMVGKWHARHVPEARPEVRGFDHFTGIYPHVDSYWKVLRNCDIYRDGKVLIPSGDDPVNPYNPGQEFYTTDFFTDAAMDYVDQAVQDTEKPFLLHVCYNAPHFPLEAPDDLIEKYRGRYLTGWDTLRKEKLLRMKEMGLVPDGQQLPREYSHGGQKTPDLPFKALVDVDPLPEWGGLNDRDESTWELYDLTNDRSETDNVITTHPEIAGKLKAKWRTWAMAANVLPFPEDCELIGKNSLRDIQ